jgi:hypothetical protein
MMAHLTKWSPKNKAKVKMILVGRPYMQKKSQAKDSFGTFGLDYLKMLGGGINRQGQLFVRHVVVQGYLILDQFSLPVSHVPIQAGSLAINCPAEELPEGWTMHIHPEGKPYYHRVAMEPPTGLLTGVSAVSPSVKAFLTVHRPSSLTRERFCLGH